MAFPLAAVASITLFAFVVRVLQLDYVNIHSDEAHFIRIAYQGTLMQATAYDDPHPPLFLAMLQAWMGVAGISQVGIRLLPILYGTLLVPVTYQLGRLVGSRRLGVAAAFVVAANPVFIFYAKEVRNNGLLAFTGALSFVLLLLALRRPALLPAYIVAALAALYSHYYDIPVVALQWLVGLLWLARHHKLRLWPWAGGPAAILAGFAPWALYARSTVANYDAGRGSLAQIGRVLAETYTAFNLGFSIDPGYVLWLGLAMAGLLVLGLAGLAIVRRSLPLFAVAYLLLPIVFGALTLLRQTNFNPRYLFAGAPGYALIMGGGVLLLWRFHPVVGALTGAFLLGLTGLTINNTDFTPRFQPNGYGEMTAYLARHVAPSDTMVLDGVSQWPLYFYYGQLRQKLPQQVEFLPRETEAATQDTVNQLLGAGGVWYVESDVDRYDPRHDTERLLAARGYEALDLHFAGQRLEYFAGSPAGPLKPSEASQGSLRLVGATAPDRPISAGQPLAVELDWQRGATPVSPFKTSLRLETEDRAIAGQNDTLPLGGYADFSAWQPGQTMHDRAALIVPVGTVPGSYRLSALIYDAAAGRALGSPISLGTVAIDHAQPQRADADELPSVGAIIGSVRLEAASVPASAVTPGDRVPLTLLWSGGPLPAAVHVTVAVGDERQDHIVGGTTYPTTAWRPEDVVRDVVAWRVRPSASADDYSVSVDGTRIGTLRVLPVQRSFDVPPLSHPLQARFGDVIELLGYDLQSQPTAVHLQLVWRALSETDVSYTAFVHLLDRDGRVASQVDVPPGTDRWAKGQVVTTSYDLPASAAPGQYRVEIGLYEQPTGKRLAVCCGGADSVILPSP